MSSNPSEITRQEDGRKLAPWSIDECRSLNAFQRSGRFHPFTCAHCRNTLLATHTGWMCVACGKHVQDWCHPWMADWSWRQGEPAAHRVDIPPPPAGCASCGQLWAEVNQLRAAIVEHHAQKADDRCWLDDRKLYEAAGLPTEGYDQVGSPSEMLKNCERFVTMRCSGGGPWKSYRELEEENAKLRALVDGLHYDDGDLTVSGAYLLGEVNRLRRALTHIAEQTPGLWKTDRQIAAEALAGEGKG